MTVYIPASGVTGKLRRIAARTLAVRPMKIALERTIVSFTFDDFPKSAAVAGAEILQARGWRGTYFATGAFAGGETHLGRMYETADLIRLDAAGHEIACHTFSHSDSAAQGDQATAADCARNRAFLRLAGHDGALETFAFPYGEAAVRAKPRLLETYRALRGVRPGVNRTGADRGLLKAVPLDGGEAGLERALDWIEDAALKPGWLIFYGHDVRAEPGPWGCTPAFLERVCETVARARFEVLPMRAALDRIKAA
ncbi:MAG: polysaccharide deacetylase family protein [Oceanicaulis sp.]